MQQILLNLAEMNTPSPEVNKLKGHQQTAKGSFNKVLAGELHEGVKEEMKELTDILKLPSELTLEELEKMDTARLKSLKKLLDRLLASISSGKTGEALFTVDSSLAQELLLPLTRLSSLLKEVIAARAENIPPPLKGQSGNIDGLEFLTSKQHNNEVKETQIPGEEGKLFAKDNSNDQTRSKLDSFSKSDKGVIADNSRGKTVDQTRQPGQKRLGEVVQQQKFITTKLAGEKGQQTAGRPEIIAKMTRKALQAGSGKTDQAKTIHLYQQESGGRNTNTKGYLSKEAGVVLKDNLTTGNTENDTRPSINTGVETVFKGDRLKLQVGNNEFGKILNLVQQPRPASEQLNTLTTRNTPVYRTNLVGLIEQLSKVIKLNTYSRNHHQIRIQLEPEMMGKIKINLRFKEGEVLARLVVENQGVKNYLEQNLTTLRSNLSRQGLNLEQFDIQTEERFEAGTQEQGQGNQHSDQQGNNRENHHQQRFLNIALDEMEFPLEDGQLREGLLINQQWMILNQPYPHMNLLA